MSDEKWLPILGYEDQYEVSDHGRVRSLKGGLDAPRIIAAKPGADGYPAVHLWSNGIGKTRLIHRLVTTAFLGPRPDGLVNRHLDGDKTNNRLSNLTYGTHRENNLDTVAHGAHHLASRTHCHKGHEYTPENTRYVLGRSGRICLTCRRERGRLDSQRRRDRARARRESA